jgi:archaellum biogenesis ATPase FlaH
MSATTYDNLFNDLVAQRQRPDQVPQVKLEFLIEPELPKGQLILLTGKPKHGKSILTLTWVMEVGLKGTPVIYLDRENGTVTMQDRFRRFPKIPDNLLFWGIWFKKDGELHQSPSVEDGFLLDIVSSMKIPPLIVVDNFSTFGGKFDENSNTDINRFMNHLRPLLALGCTVLLLHHPGRKNPNPRGGSAFEAAADVVLTVSSEFAPNKFITKMLVECTLTRNGGVEDQKYVFVDGVPVRVQPSTISNPADKIMQCLEANPGLTKEKFTDLAMKKTGITEKLIRTTMTHAELFKQAVYEKRNGETRKKLYPVVNGTMATCH